MAQIVVSDRAREMLHRHAHKELEGSARRQEDGSFAMEVSAALYEELKARQFPGETLSAVILRHIPMRTGGRR